MGTELYAKLLTKEKRVNLPTINRLDKMIKDGKNLFNTRISEYSGTYFQEGDRSDDLTSDIQDEILNTRLECDKQVKGNVVKKIIGKIPLPPFFPVVREKQLIILRFGQVEDKVRLATNRRRLYRDICYFAFNSEAIMDDIRHGELDCSKWKPEFQLLRTNSSENTWAVLGYTEEGMRTWWAEIRVDAELNNSFADLKAFCKSIVFVSDDIYSQTFGRLSCRTDFRDLAKQCQDIAFMLVRQMSLYPQYAAGISTLFGISVPLVFALYTLTDRAVKLVDDAETVRLIRIERVLQGVRKLKPLIHASVSLIEEFGENLRYHPFNAECKDDELRRSYVPRPSVAQLFCTHPSELSCEAEAAVLESGLAPDKVSLSITMDRLQRNENVAVCSKIVMDSSIEVVPTYIETVLKQIGLDFMPVKLVSDGMLGHGSSSIVSLHSSLRDPSKKYAVKLSKLAGKAWNTLIREASIWVMLQHENILPLLGYCMLPPQDQSDSPRSNVPGLVTPHCAGGCLTKYLRDHCVTYRRKMELLQGIASGLAYLHSRGICHGDLRAANILIDETIGKGRVMLCDFGLSDFFVAVAERFYKPSEDQRTENKWLAPELMFADTNTVARVSAKGDIYAYGCVILEVVFGKEPYHSCPPHREVNAKQEGEIPASRLEMDDTYWPVAEKCWRYLPEERPTADWILSFLANRLRYYDTN